MNVESSIPGASRLVTTRIVLLGGCEPSRIVLDHQPGSYQPYSTHIECVPTDGRRPYCVTGHYFFDIEEAVQDLGARYVRDLARQLEDVAAA